MKKVKKGCLIIVLVLIIMAVLLGISVKYIAQFIFQPSVQGVQTLKLGDYVYFGKYYDKPILWRVINIDKDGAPLLFAERIICLKAFDAEGEYHTDRVKVIGSCYWPDSNIRQWLNSAEKNIDWIQNAPSEENVTFNAYDQEKGFLADGNFTLREREAIKQVSQKVLLNEKHKKVKDGGEDWYLGSAYDLLADMENSYDSAYYKNVTDKVFFLSVVELKQYVYDRGWECRRKPTNEAVENSSFKRDYRSSKSYCIYWLRTPTGSSGGSSVYVVTDIKGFRQSNTVVEFLPCSGETGVCPALYLNMESISIKSGSGTEKKPYVLESK